MAVYFFDTSVIVKRYVQETGTAWVQGLTAPSAGHSLILARITLVETIAAVTRRARFGNISPVDAATAITDFEFDFGRQYFIIEISAGLVVQAASLAKQHALRGYDAVQLAAAIQLHAQDPSMTLISADAELNKIALTAGLTVEDPNTHP